MEGGEDQFPRHGGRDAHVGGVGARGIDQIELSGLFGGPLHLREEKRPGWGCDLGSVLGPPGRGLGSPASLPAQLLA